MSSMLQQCLLYLYDVRPAGKLDRSVNMVSAQVVAGLEPEKTNMFLQMLGRAALEGGVQEESAQVTNASAKPPEAALQNKSLSGKSSQWEVPRMAGPGPPGYKASCTAGHLHDHHQNFDRLVQ